MGETVLQERPKLLFLYRDAAFRVAAGGREVQENSRATPRIGWVIVPTHHNAEIIDVVFTPESLARRRVRQGDRAIVIGMGWIVAPAVTGADRFDGQFSATDRAGRTIGTVENTPDRQLTDGGAEITFGLVKRQTALTCQSRNDFAPEVKKSAVSSGFQNSFSHNAVSFCGCTCHSLPREHAAFFPGSGNGKSGCASYER